MKRKWILPLADKFLSDDEIRVLYRSRGMEERHERPAWALPNWMPVRPDGDGAEAMLAKDPYDRGIERIADWLERFGDEADRRTVLEKVKSMVAWDLAESYQSSMVYNYDAQNIQTWNLFPHGRGLPSAAGKLRTKKGTEVNLSDVPVVVVPWSMGRLRRWTERIQKFVYNPENHKGDWYENMGIAVITEGRHSSFIGTGMDDALVRLDTVHDAVLLENFDTDGRKWIHKNGRTEKVTDFRAALLFWVQKKLMELDGG